MKNFIIKGSILTLLASSTSLTGVATYADAEENTSNSTEMTQTVDLQTITDIQVTDTPVEAEGSTDVVADVTLLPGDFFYFLKTFIEKLQVTLTFEDKEKASLLAEFAAERIAEADALLKQDNEELALEVLEKAILTIENSDEFMIEEEVNVEEDSTEVTVEETTTENDNETTELTEEEVIVNVDEEVEQEIQVETEHEGKLAQNIIALTLALEKVKNPVAKAALARNIEKSLAKFEKKIAKMQAKTEKVIQKETASDEVVEIETEVEATTEVVIGLETVTLEDDNKVDTSIEETNQVVAPLIQAKEESKVTTHSKKDEAKEKKKHGLEIAKEKREEAKIRATEKREHAKGKKENNK
ncbi:DUF5667 domain-containing protein [Bacillus sp. DJP31]|uniref:DUF5667 domain-containing protein n=1 Tax=Bacillus sp. DJP31 TaxID=3409789 RepID=UPI003BB77B3C